MGCKVLFAGVCDPERPGSIHVLRHPWEKVFEVQAHSLPVEKLKLSYDNQYLFSGGRDGVLCAFDIRDKEPKLRKDGKDLISTPLSEEVLITKAESDKFKETIEQIRATINSQREARGAKKKFELQQTENEYIRITNQIDENKILYE